MLGQTTTTLSTSLGKYYDKLFLTWEEQLLRMKQFAQMRPIPAHTGEQVFFTGYRPLALVTSALTQQTNPTTPKSFESRQISATVKEWGDTVKMGKLLELAKLDPGVEEQVRIVADQAARTLDYQMMREVCYNGIYGISAANVSTDNRTVTVASSSTNSTVKFVVTTTSHHSAAWVGAVATVIYDPSMGGIQTGNTLWGYAGRVSVYASSDAAGDTYTLSSDGNPGLAAPESFSSDMKVHLAKLENITSANVLTTELIRRAQRDLTNFRAPFIRNGYYAAVITPDSGYDFKGDTTWVSAAQYSNVEELYRGEIGRWFGFRFVETTQPYRETTSGVEARLTGTVWHNLFMGANGFGHTELMGANQKLIYINQGPDKTDPLDMYSIFGWKQIFANKALTAPHVVSIMTGVSA